MWRDLSWIAGHFLLITLPAAIFLAALFEWGAFERETFLVLVLALVALTISSFGWVRVLRFASRKALADLGPENTGASFGKSKQRQSFYARSVRSAALRLDRAWREHAARTEARLAEAEAVIGSAPDPLIVIDRQRHIVRANAAAAKFIGPIGEARDLAAAVRNPALLAAADAVLSGEPARSVEFALAGPVERVLSAHIAAIDGSPLAGAA